MISSSIVQVAHKKALDLSQMLSTTDQEYIRQRLSPHPGDLEYLVISDLRLAIESIKTDASISILDYGANLSPYHSLFPMSLYKRADIDGHGARDYVISPDGTVPEQSEKFDMILSTQVAEHVTSPDTYFAECFRLLKPAGVLFLSTHGFYEEHGFPYDFQRWTAGGIKRDLAKAGFESISVKKLTTGPRAGLYQLERCLETTFLPRKTIPGLLYWLSRIVIRRLRRPLHQLADRWYTEYRMVPDDALYHNMYIGLVAIARRP